VQTESYMYTSYLDEDLVSVCLCEKIQYLRYLLSNNVVIVKSLKPFTCIN
jgi:hypothetical protein